MEKVEKVQSPFKVALRVEEMATREKRVEMGDDPFGCLAFSSSNNLPSSRILPP